MKTAHEIIKKIGKSRFKAELGVADRTINQYTQAGVLPSAWFEYCEYATRRKLDRKLFSFKAFTPVDKGAR